MLYGSGHFLQDEIPLSLLVPGIFLFALTIVKKI